MGYLYSSHYNDDIFLQEKISQRESPNQPPKFYISKESLLVMMDGLSELESLTCITPLIISNKLWILVQRLF